MTINTCLKEKFILWHGIVLLIILFNHDLYAVSACIKADLDYFSCTYPAILIMLFFYTLLILFLGNIFRRKNIELKTLKIKLDTAENKVRTLLTAFTDLLFILDDNCNFIDYKAETEDELYASPSEFLGKNINEVLPPDLVAITTSKINTAIHTGSMQKYNYELNVHGEKHYYNARIVHLDFDFNLVIVRNISESKKRKEEETKSHRLESISLFASGIAHDFNNILTAIAGYISLGRKKIENNNDIPMVIELLNEAEREVMSAGKLTEQLLVFSKEGCSVKEHINIKELVTRSVDFIMSGSKTAISYNFSDDIIKVKVDINRISQVIQNIVLNASQAMNSAGTVYISVYKRLLSKGNKLALSDGVYAVIEVRDEGEGIETRNLRRIFDPYFTTKKDCNGLGLTISRNIIEDHYGYIDVKSQAGKGTVFTVFIPVKATEENIIYNKPSTMEVKSLTNVSAIIMDDEPQLRYIMQQVLEDEGVVVSVASEGIEAIELFEKLAASGKPPDIVIADLTIPGGMGGMEAVRIIREQGVAFKAIVISGYGNDPVISDYKSYGFDAYLIKPFTSNDLLSAVKQIC